MSKKLAPIVIFTYRRNIDELLESLLENELSKESEVYIFSDGYKNEIDKKDVLEVRSTLTNIHGFKKVIVYESDKNKGLADSIINGVNKIIFIHKKVIVLEDDLVVADNFLNYMNDALDFYEDNATIWSISGYTPTLKCLENYEEDVFLSLRANSWGWATWEDRWDRIDWEIEDWEIFKKDKQKIQKFNMGGNDLFRMLETQMLGKIDSWAVRWCYNQFRFNMFTLYPTQSKLANLGFDKKGTHNSTGFKRWEVEISNAPIKFKSIELNNEIVDCFSKQYNLTLKTKIGYFLKQYGGYSLAKNIMKLIL